jgi:hypothetical protein
MAVAMGVAGLSGASTTGGPFTQAGEGVGWRTAIRSWGRVAARPARQQPFNPLPRDHADGATLGARGDQKAGDEDGCDRMIPHSLGNALNTVSRLTGNLE